MKTIVLMRHAKSDWGAQYESDFQRPLNTRGLRDAPVMAAFLARHKLLPAMVVTSPAQRARVTADYVVREDMFSGELIEDDRIYLASATMLLDVVHDLPEAIDSVMLVGHNPGMEDLISTLSGGVVRMPTAAIASLRLHTDAWADVQPGSAHLQWLVKPKILR
ncbi:MAG: hypothetical protein DSY55_01340 [Clostridia bacterium]|nr:MAG: hypothetical protein DSY55_01340 [Clostridia bacterium]